MKVVLISGDDTVRSRERFGKILDSTRKRGWQIVHVGKSLSDNSGKESLFDENILYVVDGIKNLSTKDFDWLKSSEDKNILIFHKGAAPQGLINSLPKETKHEKFTLPRIIFKFVESLSPGNSKDAITLFHKAAKESPFEMIMGLVATYLRDIYWLKVDPKGPGYPSWRQSKLTRSAEKFNKQKVASFLHDLLALDIKSKTSKIDSLAQFDVLLVKHLK